MKSIITAFLSLILIANISAQTVFEKTYGNSEYDFGTTVKETLDGNFMIACVINDGTDNFYNLIKINNLGDTIWIKKFLSYGATEIYKIPMIISLDGNIVFVQNTQITPGVQTMTITKVDLDGSIIWESEYSGLSVGGNALDQNPDSSCIISYYNNSSYLLKLDINGQELFNISVNSYFTMGLVTENDGYVLSGISLDGSESYFISKVDANGNELWLKTYPGATLSELIFNSGITNSNDGGYIMYSTKTTSSINGYLMKFDNMGDIIWTNTYPELSFTDCINYENNSYVLTGFYDDMVNDTNDAILLKVNETGTILWQRNFNLEQYSFGLGVSSTSDNGFIISGFQEFVDEADVYVIKCDSYGYVATNDIIYPETNLRVYPNPTTNDLYISLDEIIISEAFIYNQFGQKVLSAFRPYEKIDVSSLKSGIYVIELITNEARITQKLIIK